MGRFRSGGRRRAAALVAVGALAAGSLAAGPVAAVPAPPGPHIRWGGDCPERPVPSGLECGTLTVPLDHAAPAKGTVDLALARIPAAGPQRRGSLLLNFGGPGAPGIATLADVHREFADLGEAYDLVTFDPRGVGHSAPVSCGGALRDGPPAPDDDVDAPEAPTAAAKLAALRLVAERCAQHSGPVLPYIGTIHVARDMDLIRQALGEDRLDYLGFSYGTRLGAAYAAQFPQRTGRMALDGVDTLSESLAEQALVSAKGQQQALDNFLSWCARRSDCVYGTNTRTAKEKVRALVARLDRSPLTGPDGASFTGQDIIGAIATGLYSTAQWPALARGLRLAERQGDPAGLLEVGGPTDPEPEEDPAVDGSDPVPDDNGEAALVAVNCADDPGRGKDAASPEAVEKEIEALKGEFRKASRIFGPSQLMTVLSCYGRPPGTDFIRKIDRPGAPRMLLVGTRGDPATPYQWTEETARLLGSAAILDHKGDGHTGYAGSGCVRGRVNAFLIDGELPNGTQSCPAED
ncbi:alpha/beta hydrolase [Streptomyces venezuelae]|uniref:Alpha/beta hydrolase n=1 Tax=Streptomyces venezuelae TaxID=54571 RepID=A0A5P2D8S9_STRVZ|nr:alpha/beta hydrolase [Streptomyces venezuelae]QES49559.1 alpha/beta hydrolase [Streptomyces venezuelae]